MTAEQELAAAADGMVAHAHVLAAAVADRRPDAVRTILARIRALPIPAGADPMDVLAVVLADLVPTCAEAAVLGVLRRAEGPADATALLEVLGLAGHGEPGPAMAARDAPRKQKARRAGTEAA